jgi:RNA polymerase sigma factor (sigma-70 family)
MATVAPEVPLLARDEAFERLYRTYVKDVYHYALALLRNPADAEDVTQTTFMNAYRAYTRGDEILKPQNWLIKIAHNVARSRYSRTARRVKEVPLEEHIEQLAVPEDERPNVEGVLRALGRLPFNQRAALVMRELEGRSYVEISDTLGVSVAAVETLIFRARRSLRLRASALKSITAVPVPTSLTQLFGGGGAVGGAVAGSVGTGFLVKTAVVLIAGAFATGVGGDRGNRAVASPGSPTVSAATSSVTAAKSLQTAGTQPSERPANAVLSRHGTVRATRPTEGPASVVIRSASQPAPTSAVSSASASAPPSVSTPPASEVVTKTVDTTVGTVEQTVGTVEQTVGTVEQTVTTVVTTVTGALPVQLPQLPVQPPPLPKLP